MEATHKQAVVCVVPRIPDRHILEQTMAYAKDVLGLGVHIPSPVEHAPRPVVPETWLVPLEEFTTYVLKTCHGKGNRNRFFPVRVPLALPIWS